MQSMVRSTPSAAAQSGESPAAEGRGGVRDGSRRACVIVVDDDTELVRELGRDLRGEGYEVLDTADGWSALDLVRMREPAAVVLDITLAQGSGDPRGCIDGLEVLSRIRAESEVPVLILSQTRAEVVKLLAFQKGADDYVTKPFGRRELLARIEVVIRRRCARAGEAVLDSGAVRVDRRARRAWCRDVEVSLTPLEFDLLAAMAAEPGRAWPREMLVRKVWGPDFAGDERVVDVAVGRIRRKLERDAGCQGAIVTVRGVGYRLASRPG